MKRVVITGATGFVGANLARRMLSEGYEVHLLLRFGANPWRITEIKGAVCCHYVNFFDAAQLISTFRTIRPDWIFHLAAYGAYSSQTDPQTMVQTNINATINLVAAGQAVGFEAFINTGSSSEYGFKTTSPREDTWLEPNSLYAITKAAATHYCSHTARAQQLPIVTLRLYSVFGPYEEPTRLLPTLILDGLHGTLPPLVDRGIARDYVYIDDVCDAYMIAATKAMAAQGTIYNIGTDVQTSLEEVVAITRYELDLKVEPEWGSMPNRRWDSSTWVADSSRFRAEFAWNPRYTFHMGFKSMLKWIRAESEWQAFYQEHRILPH